jgi:sodium/bile acid cotransporter 7
MTKQAKGDEAGALTNAALGNILGVFVSPTLIFAYAGSLSAGGSLDYKSTFIDLTITVIIPLIVGQLIQLCFPKFVVALGKHVNLAIVNSCFLLLLVWSVFCDTFAANIGDRVDAGSLVSIVFIDLALFMLFSAIAFGVSRIPALGFSREETVCDCYKWLVHYFLISKF